ncbi:ATP:corrinoid adenosyltransferase [Rubidibacter lacunae KORDI 51-2]|uniref:ATP:corrinoid adenosyltransferase n=1 Tax=Rubidibacter lacunae KORDI 51-2 TaxID=582515 RepID=U5DM93_9CHRO|nr:P-loop NTPase family protein [Rubidibacter lacunae]ERN41704.1 ATP:corrinoid adenosyltransferase [Rubidibacter lacunae KORDI 51-2]
MVGQIETSKLGSDAPFPGGVEGLVQVFTGAQRAFFTGVMAQALRLATQGTPVLVVQFLKGGIRQGTEHAVRLGQHLDWLRCDLTRIIDTAEIEEGEISALRRLWEHTSRVIEEGRYALVVLDELSLAVHFGLVPLDEVLSLMRDRPAPVDLILTGPEMPQPILDLADQITEIRRSHQP